MLMYTAGDHAYFIIKCLYKIQVLTVPNGKAC